MHKRFAMIDMTKSQSLSKKKGREEKLKLVNKLKIITTPEEVYNLWSKVMRNAVHGDFGDPISLFKFNEKKKLEEIKDFILDEGNTVV